MRQIYLYSPSPDAPAIDVNAIQQRNNLAPDDQLQTTASLPALEDLAQLATDFPPALQDTLTRYWQNQAAGFTPKVASQYGILFDSPVTETGFLVLQDTWNGNPAGTVCFKMQSTTLGALIVFTALSLHASGQVEVNGRVASLDYAPAAAASAADASSSTTSNVESSIFAIMNAIGAGIAASGFPIVGGIFQALFSIIANWLNPNSDTIDEVVSEIQTLLQQNNIAIEKDFATAEINTWMNWESVYFNQTDFTTLSAPNPDKTSPQYTEALNNANIFINNVHQAFTTPSPLFDAVNLMFGNDQTNSENLDQPTQSMYEFSPFLFFSSFVLLMGKQAWLYSQQINGASSQITTDLAQGVAGYSAQYTTYVQNLSAAIQQQINSRLSYLQVNQSLGSGSWLMVDNYNGPTEQHSSNAWKIFGFNGDSVYNCCGSSDCNQAQKKAENAQTQLGNDFTNYFYKLIDSGGQTDLQQKVQLFIDNNTKLQNLKTSS